MEQYCVNMEILYIIIFFILGLVLGSFYNVVGIRICKKESLVFPGSHCQNCDHKLKPYELIPVISYIFLKGKCKNCKQKISIMYPVIELITAVLFALSFYVYGLTPELILSLLISSLFVIVVVTDINYYIIPDSILIVFAVLIFIYNIVTKGILDACTYVVYGLIMFLFMYALMKLGNFLFKEESLGGGDIKLMAVLGMTTKPLVSVLSLSLGALIALPGSLYLLIRKKDKIIPFGPFILGAFLIVMFTGIDATDIINYLLNTNK